jgi:DNA invertase Pin-like site-specific DNA recombinase
MLKQKAVGYVCDIPIPDTSCMITRENQRNRIVSYAREANLDLVTIYEDPEFTEPFVNRRGIRQILTSKDQFDVLLVERVWCLSRKMRELEPFLERLYKRNVELKTCAYLWDCVSQQVRHHSLVKKLRRAREEARKTREAA